MCFDYDDRPEFQNDRVVKARKDHDCTVCRGPIRAGEKYHAHTGKCHGQFYDDKVCRRCDYDRFRVVEHELAEGCSWGEAWPANCELLDYLADSGLGQTWVEDVPESFQVGDTPKRPVAAGS